jgi:hypothetical protein|tara:strand:- start:507 stop:992 length:486 start_codon:yes stop_codon:yes gene_type:complete
MEEDTPRINIDELYQTKQKIDLNRLELFNKLLKRIHIKIKHSSKQREQLNFCSFVMPEILIGYPNYNQAECLNYIISILEKDGFNCKYIHPNLLMISWNHWVPEYVRNEIKKKTGIQVDSYGNKKEKIYNPFKPEKSKSKKQENLDNIYGENLINSMKSNF